MVNLRAKDSNVLSLIVIHYNAIRMFLFIFFELSFYHFENSTWGKRFFMACFFSSDILS